jgi:flagellar hook-basal body complex protein FliE
MDPIRAIGPGGMERAGGVGGAPPSEGGRSFKNVLSDAMAEVNRLQQDADTAITRLQTGRDVNLTEVILAVEKADLAFKTLMQIRNKLVDAYKQVEQMRL